VFLAVVNALLGVLLILAIGAGSSLKASAEQACRSNYGPTGSFPSQTTLNNCLAGLKLTFGPTVYIGLGLAFVATIIYSVAAHWSNQLKNLPHFIVVQGAPAAQTVVVAQPVQ
jgi:hypothetical protein